MIHTQSFKPFLSYAAVQKLQNLASHPVDLTDKTVLTPDRIQKYCVSSCGYELLYGTERVNDEVLKALSALAEESQAVDQMERMQSGEIMNVIQGYPSENRAVLHTATRDFFDDMNESPEAKHACGLARREVDKLRDFLEEIGSNFTHMIAIGIGGSELGPNAHYLALQGYCQGREVRFLSNVDPDEASLVLRDLPLEKTLVAVISKSGSTMEPTANEEFLRARFTSAGLKPEKHFIAITGKDSPLDTPKKYRACFYIWDWIGGRYSTTSMVGGVPLAFSFGFEVYWEFLQGANEMDKAALERNPLSNMPLLAALLGIWNRNFINCPTLAVIPYSQALRRYPAHLQQLSMESNGKHIDRNGNKVNFATCPIVWGEPGTNAQHSFFQLIHQGTDIVPLEIIAFARSQIPDDFAIDGTTLQQKLLSNVFAQALALATGEPSQNPNKECLGNRPSHIILGHRLTPFSLGALLAFFEHKTAFQGFLWGINSFDQEGVQLGKKLATRVLQRMAGTKGEGYPLADALLVHLRKQNG